MPKLFKLAEKEGIHEHTGMTRAQLIVGVVRRQIERGEKVDRVRHPRSAARRLRVPPQRRPQLPRQPGRHLRLPVAKSGG